MATKAQLKANEKYHSKFYVVRFRVPLASYDHLKNYVESQGKSLNAYINDLIMADMASHGQSLPPSGTSGTEPEPEEES